MRVAMLGSFPADPERMPGGVEAVIRNLATELALLPDLDVHILTCVRGAREAREIEYRGVHLHYLPGQASLGNLTLHRGDRRTLARALDRLRPDIVHGHGTDAYASAVVDTAWPQVVTVHGILYKEVVLYRGLKGLVRRWALSGLERRVLQRSRHILIIARYVQEAIAPWTRATFHQVANPVDRARFDLPATDDGRTILSVATVQQRKGQMVLVEALAQVREQAPDARLVLLGKVVEPEYEAALKRRVDELGLQGAVHIGGFVSDEVRDQALQECAVFSLASLEESSPVSIAEAMTLGKPVVATRVGGVPDLVAEGRTGYLTDHGDVAGTAEALLRILGDAGHRRTLGEAGAARARADFHPEAVARQTVAVYEQIIEEARTS
jgi:glycosyltransferase involved in cell wall biosynthesis